MDQPKMQWKDYNRIIRYCLEMSRWNHHQHSITSIKQLHLQNNVFPFSSYSTTNDKFQLGDAIIRTNYTNKTPMEQS